MSEQAAETDEIGLPWGGVRRSAFMIDMLIGHTVEFIGAMLVLAETCILFAGVVSRYVFNSPIMWTDELATFLFLWLSMLGAVVALRRDGHMRLTTFATRVGPKWGGWLATVAALVVVVFVLEILVPAHQFLEVALGDTMGIVLGDQDAISRQHLEINGEIQIFDLPLCLSIAVERDEAVRPRQGIHGHWLSNTFFPLATLRLEGTTAGIGFTTGSTPFAATGGDPTSTTLAAAGE